MKMYKWMNEWLDNQVKITTKEPTYKKYCLQVEKYIIPFLGEYETDSLSAREMYKFSGEIKAKGLSSSTVNCIITILKSALKTAIAVGIMSNPVYDALVRPPLAWKKTGCFNVGEQKKIEKYILTGKDPKLYGILLCLYSGLRIGELLALTWEDIDLVKGAISITKSCRDSWKNGKYVKILDKAKTDTSIRVIPLPRTIIGYLKELKKHTKCKFVVIGKTEFGAQIRSYQRTFTNLLIKLGIEHRSFHALRHTFATRALEVGMDVKTLSDILGHKNPNITLQRYAHSLMEHKAEMMNKLGRLMTTDI